MASAPSFALRIGELNLLAQLQVGHRKFEFVVIAVCDRDTEVQCQELEIQIMVER